MLTNIPFRKSFKRANTCPGTVGSDKNSNSRVEVSLSLGISWKFVSIYISTFIKQKLTDLNWLHNSPIYDECQTQSAKVLALPWKRAHQDDSNDTPQPIGEFQVDFPLLWIKDYPGLS